MRPGSCGCHETSSRATTLEPGRSRPRSPANHPKCAAASAGAIDFVGLLPSAEYDTTTDVMNGIAYDAPDDRLFVTGKNWPELFEVKLKPK